MLENIGNTRRQNSGHDRLVSIGTHVAVPAPVLRSTTIDGAREVGVCTAKLKVARV